MKVCELKEKLNLQTLCETDSSTRKEVTSGFCCDLHSFVMANAPENCAWLTVIGDINSVAVCIYSNISVLILTGDAQLDEDARQKAIEYSVEVLKSEEHSFSLCAKLKGILDREEQDKAKINSK